MVVLSELEHFLFLLPECHFDLSVLLEEFLAFLLQVLLSALSLEELLGLESQLLFPVAALLASQIQLSRVEPQDLLVLL